MRTFVKTLIIALFMVHLAPAFSHGLTEPQHGGIVKVAGDVSLELVNGKDAVHIYMLSDEKISTDGMKAKIKVENANGESEHKLLPIEGAGFVGKGVTIPGGSEVLAIITLKNGYSKVAGKFEIE